MATKEIIKRLMAERKVGTEQLYIKIPVFMRTRLSNIIDSIKWADISEGCVMGKPGSKQQAQEKYNEILAHINQYILLCRSKPSDTDNGLFMMADYNYIQNEYGSDPCKFAKEMANCIQMEKDLIENFKSLPAMDLAEPESEEMEQKYTHDPFLDKLEDAINEAEYWCSLASGALPKRSTLYENMETSDVFGETGVTDVETNMETLSDVSGETGVTDVETYESCKTLAIEKIKEISAEMEMFCNTLKIKVDEWNNAEAKKSVGVGPGLPFKELERNFYSFGKSLQKVLAMFDAEGSLAFFHEEDLGIHPADVSSMSPVALLHQTFKNIEKFLFEINLVVDIQPKDLMSIESAGKKDREDSATASKATEGSKKQKNYCTKKNQNIETLVRILGVESFPNVVIESASIDLVSERDLAPQQTLSVTGRERRPKLDFKTNHTDFGVRFSEVAVKNFSRIEQNTVYKQFFRIQYLINVEVNGVKYSLKTLSLPFMFHTGSNQILELIGARMWYLANVDDMYHGNFTCPDSLDVNQVIDMLDNRVANLDNKRIRSLAPDEREFLKKRLPTTTGDKVTMQGFIKDKMKKSRNLEELPFSFHTWFHAVLHSFQEYLLEPWINGIIFGFCSETTTKEILMRSDIAQGTFILRPSISTDIKNMSSKEATAGITMDIKLRIEEGTDPAEMYQVQSVPIFLKTIIKNSLYGAIYGILKNDRPIAKIVHTTSGDKPVSCLKRFKGKTDSKNQIFKDYQLMIDKVEKISIRSTVQGSSSHDGNQDDLNHSGPGPSTRKRPLLSTQSSTGSRTGEGRSTVPMSRSASREDRNVPHFHNLANNELNQEPQTAETFPWTSRPIPTQGQRLGRQSNSVPETHNGFPLFTHDNSLLTYNNGIQVDTSNIRKTIPVHNDNNSSLPAITAVSLNLIQETAMNNEALGSQLFELHQEGFPSTGSSTDSFSSSTNTMSPESRQSESAPDNLPTVLQEALDLELSIAESRSNINKGRNSNPGFNQSFRTLPTPNGFAFHPNRNGLSMNGQNMNPSSTQTIGNQWIDPWGSPNDSGIDGDETPSPEPIIRN